MQGSLAFTLTTRWVPAAPGSGVWPVAVFIGRQLLERLHLRGASHQVTAILRSWENGLLVLRGGGCLGRAP